MCCFGARGSWISRKQMPMRGGAALQSYRSYCLLVICMQPPRGITRDVSFTTSVHTQQTDAVSAAATPVHSQPADPEHTDPILSHAPQQMPERRAGPALLLQRQCWGSLADVGWIPVDVGTQKIQPARDQPLRPPKEGLEQLAVRCSRPEPRRWTVHMRIRPACRAGVRSGACRSASLLLVGFGGPDCREARRSWPTIPDCRWRNSALCRMRAFARMHLLLSY